MKTVAEMAVEAGIVRWWDSGNDQREVLQEHLERLVELARADEREAMVAEAAKKGWGMRNDDPFEDCVREIAAIRARGQA